MLDTLIGNTDRHHENWAVVGHRPEGKDALFYLAPTFDHASSLGCHLTDEIRRDRLSTRNTQRNMLAYTNKALSAIYALDTDKKPMSPIEVIRCARHLTPAAADYWLSKLVFVTMDNLRDLFSYLPLDRITPIAAEFAIALLDINRKRLLNLREEAQ